MNSNEIKKKVAYFKKVIKNMDNKQFEKENLKKEAGFEEYNTLPSEIEEMCFTEDKHFHSNLLDWIELVENTDLYDALKSLSIEEQTLLSYLYHKSKTQTEMAKFYGIA